MDSPPRLRSCNVETASPMMLKLNLLMAGPWNRCGEPSGAMPPVRLGELWRHGPQAGGSRRAPPASARHSHKHPRRCGPTSSLQLPLSDPTLEPFNCTAQNLSRLRHCHLPVFAFARAATADPHGRAQAFIMLWAPCVVAGTAERNADFAPSHAGAAIP